MEMYDLVIIGGGPGGIAAAIYALRARMKTILIEKAGIGGQIALSDIVENYPGFPALSGMDLMQKFEEHAKKEGLDVKYDLVKSIRKENDTFHIEVGKETLPAKSVIIATGADPSELGIPGEREFFGKGVSTCATCDGPFYRGKDVAVIGGGDTAVKEAVFLSKLVNKLYLVHRRDQLRAEKLLQERIFSKDNVEFCWHSVGVEVKGNPQGVNGIVIENRQTKQRRTLDVEGVFIFVGLTPITKFTDCEKDKWGFLITDQNMQTSVPGLFAVGDCRVTPLRQVATAVGDGAIAAVKAEEYVSELAGKAYAGKPTSV
ncbi:MAG: thioredoxin-disulfide reductase [bacterium]|nr:MAG: thioredoxin-disulfide reductase [bacterium]